LADGTIALGGAARASFVESRVRRALVSKR